MDYIYDILLNFHEKLYEFYEWKKEDKVINVKKIPIFKISIKDYKNFKLGDIVIDKNFIDKIRGKTSYYNNNIKDKLMCLFTSENDVFGAIFNSTGKLILKSDLLIDEKEEVLEESYYVKTIKINYNIINKRCNNLTPRFEIDCKESIKKFIDNNITNEIYLKYLYYEYFDKEPSNIIEVKNKLYKIINDKWNDKLSKLYNIIIIYDKVKN